ncbi:MAG: hypothetical protein NTX46_04605 [Chloroflexi bacterium]|nr:hypothetical protein [Chloroflexota bacterium]
MEGRIVRMASVKCSSCGQNYQMRDVKILNHYQDLWFLNALCSSCHSRYIIVAVIGQDQNAEIISDLNDAELVRFNKFPTLTADDVLNMHDFLRKFDGDFSGLFCYNRRRNL